MPAERGVEDAEARSPTVAADDHGLEHAAHVAGLQCSDLHAVELTQRDVDRNGTTFPR